MPRVKEAPTRVVYLSDAPYEGGAERYLLRLAGGLDRNRFEPCLLLPDSPSLDGVEILAREGKIPTYRHAAGGFAGAGSPLELERLLRRHRPDLVHLNLPNPYHAACGWAAPVARRAGARAVVTTEHIADIPAARRRALLKRLAMHWVAAVITISRKHAELLAARHGVPRTKLHVIENGVEDGGPPRPRDAAPFTILCIGKLEPRKGQDVLVAALPRILSRGIDARLVLVGEGPARPVLEAEIARLGLSGRVELTGALPSAREALDRAHVLAVPSRIEGLPFTLLEGLAAGAAVVASALPGLEEAIEPDVSGVLLPPAEPERWAEALAALALDRTRLAALATAGRARFESRFRLDRMIRETCALYDEVLA